MARLRATVEWAAENGYRLFAERVLPTLDELDVTLTAAA